MNKIKDYPTTVMAPLSITQLFILKSLILIHNGINYIKELTHEYRTRSKTKLIIIFLKRRLTLGQNYVTSVVTNIIQSNYLSSNKKFKVVIKMHSFQSSIIIKK